MAVMADAEGWAWVYCNPRVATHRSNQVCFTGFAAAERDELHARAAATGWLKPVGTVTAQLAFLCTGEKPGPSTLAKAHTCGATTSTRLDSSDLSRTVNCPGAAQMSSTPER